MATRGATGTIVECCNYSCPQGFLLDTRRGNVRTVRVGKGTFVVRINNIYSPGMIIPKYLKRNSASNEVTLEDLGETDIILPLLMLKEHVPCNHFRPTPIHPRVTGRSQPVTTVSTQRKSGRGQVKRKHSPADGYESDDSRSSDDDDELDDEFHSPPNTLNFFVLQYLRLKRFKTAKCRYNMTSSKILQNQKIFSIVLRRC